MTYFVGLDWAAREHAVCVVDERGAVVARFTVAHTAAGMTDLAARLVKLAPAPELRIAIERPTGLVVDTLVESKFAVVPIHPNVVKAARPRYSAAQGKTDLGDAYLLADLLRTDGHRFRTLSPLSDETKALRGLVRVRDDLVGQRVAAANQLRCLLEQFWPGAGQLFADVDSPIALDFLDRYPTPQSASGLGEKRMAAFMARHSYSGRRSAADLVARLRSAPPSVAGELEAEAKGECVRALVAILRPLVAQLATLSAAIEHAVDAHPDGKIVTPLFRAGRICAAQLLAEIATTAVVSCPPTISLPRAVPRRSRASPASIAPSPSAGRATCTCARRSTRSPTPRATLTRGRAASTSELATEGTSTRMRSASSRALGAA